MNLDSDTVVLADFKLTTILVPQPASDYRYVSPCSIYILEFLPGISFLTFFIKIILFDNIIYFSILTQRFNTIFLEYQSIKYLRD